LTAIRLAIAAAAFAALSGPASAQAPAAPAARPPAGTPAQQRPGLLFKEAWRQSAGGAEAPVNLAAAVRNPDLELKVYGQGAVLNMVGKDGDLNNPSHLFSGESKNPVAFTLRDKKAYADLSTLGRLRVNTKMSGLHKVYPIVKLANGDWWLADKPAGGSIRDWLMEDVSLADARWYKLDIADVVTKGNPVDKIDLAKVDEIGFADLMPASGHGPGGWFDVGEIEVYAKPVAR